MPRTDFEPTTDGFAFANSWSLDETEESAVRDALSDAITGSVIALGPILTGPALALRVGPKLSKQIIDGLPDHYGLCGGMAFAALDYYLSGIPAPRGSGRNDQPTRETPEGTTLRDYLLQRMLDSLTAGGAAARTLTWMCVLHLLPESWPFRGGSPWLLKRTRKEWLVLRAHIDAQDPWPIGLIGETRDPFMNHQVLATGYDDHEDGTSTIYVYDMNCPDAEHTIRVDLREKQLQATESCGGQRGELRGFFCEEYSREPPPALNHG